MEIEKKVTVTWWGEKDTKSAQEEIGKLEKEGYVLESKFFNITYGVKKTIVNLIKGVE